MMDRKKIRLDALHFATTTPRLDPIDIVAQAGAYEAFILAGIKEPTVAKKAKKAKKAAVKKPSKAKKAKK